MNEATKTPNKADPTGRAPLVQVERLVSFFKNIKLERDRVCFFVGLLTIEAYWPKVLNNNLDCGVYAHSQISYKKFNEYNKWCLTRAGVFKLFGFGVGFAWKHCDNPNIDTAS